MPDINGTPNGEFLIGTSDADFIQGFGGNDTLSGLGGQDRLDGGAGTDILTGGAERDLFLFRYGEIDNDIITDLTAEDIIRFDAQPLGAFTNSITFIDEIAFTGTAGEFRTSRSNGQTFIEIDADGDAVADATVIIQNGEFYFESVTIIGIVEFVVDTAIRGSNMDDVIVGTVADEIFKSLDGDDTVDGGLGDDEIFGGDGNDTLRGGGGEDDIEGDDGNDILEGGADNDDLRGEDGDDILRGDDGNDDLSGGDGDDQLFGGAGNDDLFGGAGNDSFVAELGDDEYFGNSNDSIHEGGGDIVSYAAGTQGLNIEFWGNTNRTTLITEFGEDELTSIDGLIGTDFDDIITVPRFTDKSGVILDGGAGNDILTGGDGQDILLGGIGNDFLATGYGADTVDGGAGTDTVSFQHSYSNVDASLLTGGHTSSFQRLELLSAAEPTNTPGNPGLGRTSLRFYSDIFQDGVIFLTALSSGDTTRDPETDIRTRVYEMGQINIPADDQGREAGFLSVTMIEVQHPDDTEFFSFIIEAFNVDLSIFTEIEFYSNGLLTSDVPGVLLNILTNPDAKITTDTQTGTLANLENLIGSEFTDRLEGDDGDNTIEGGAGDDIITGGKGNDVLSGDAGKDTFYFAGNSGRDRIEDFAVADDILDLHLSPYTTFESLIERMTQMDGYVMFNIDTQNSIRIDGVEIADFTESNFRLTGIMEDGIGPFRDGFYFSDETKVAAASKKVDETTLVYEPLDTALTDPVIESYAPEALIQPHTPISVWELMEYDPVSDFLIY